jgi:hypothetical protein
MMQWWADYLDGLRFTGTADLNEPWILTVMPLRSDAPIYIEEPYRPRFVDSKQVASVVSVRILPEYQLTLPSGT